MLYTITKKLVTLVFYMKWKKYNEIQLTKKMDLNIRKMTNHPPSPDSKNEKSSPLLPFT